MLSDTKWPYNHTPIYAHDKVEPWLNSELQVGVAQDLEAKEPLLLFLPGILAVEAGDEAVEGVKHFVGCSMDLEETKREFCGDLWPPGQVSCCCRCWC